MCYMGGSRQVGVRELRQHLSVYLVRVIAGETLEVTDRGRPVAILAPLVAGESALARLAREGRVVPATADLPGRRRRIRTKVPSRSLLQRERADRQL